MKQVYSVGQVNNYIKNMFVQDYLLRNLAVRGEVSNCKYHPSGHIYFSLKDESGAMACVMFAGQRKGLAFRMKDGDKVVMSPAIWMPRPLPSVSVSQRTAQRLPFSCGVM